MSMVARELRDGLAVIDFVCERCHTAGPLSVSLANALPVACPQKCGAIYALWKNPDDEFELVRHRRSPIARDRGGATGTPKL
jgi:hypothetical protein